MIDRDAQANNFICKHSLLRCSHVVRTAHYSTKGSRRERHQYDGRAKSFDGGNESNEIDFGRVAMANGHRQLILLSF